MFQFVIIWRWLNHIIIFDYKRVYIINLNKQLDYELEISVAR